MDITLLIMAAGIGSRYGGMKQIEGFGPSGETITDYSIYDARLAGFNRFVFIISPEMEADFKSDYIKKFPADLPVEYVIQSKDDLPEGFVCPPDRTKPWGTGHAVLSAKDKITGPFAVINADDFYGRESFQILYKFLQELDNGSKGKYCTVGYDLENTLSEHGSVSRGVCEEINSNGSLKKLVERTKIYRQDDRLVYKEEEEEIEIDSKSIVSVNLFGFTDDLFVHLDEHFLLFLKKYISNNKKEFYITQTLDNLIYEEKAIISVLKTPESWFGVTNPEDADCVKRSILGQVESGKYPTPLWK